MVVNTNDTLNGLYVTKDAGLNWTKVAITTSTTLEAGVRHTSNNASDTAVNIVGNYSGGTANTPQGNADLVMTIDPTNPNIVYIGGVGPDSLIRVNITTLQDLYSFDLDSYTSDGGLLAATTAAATLVNATSPPVRFGQTSAARARPPRSTSSGTRPTRWAGPAHLRGQHGEPEQLRHRRRLVARDSAPGRLRQLRVRPDRRSRPLDRWDSPDRRQ